MKPVRLLLGAALCAFVAPQVAQSAGDNIFSGIQVHTIEFQFDQPAWWDSLTIYYNAGLEQYLPATVTVDGVPMDSVGVRFKGNATYYHPNNKKPFRIKFDEFDGALRWDGLKGVHLNNCWEDPTFEREKLHFDFCRDAGIPGPRANFAELYINGELFGFYTLIEHVDKTFLSARFGDNGGNLYKAVDGQPGGGGYISDFKWYGADEALYYNRYEMKTEESLDPWTPIIAVIDSLNNVPETELSLPPVVNLQSVYRSIGTDILLANLDSYTGSGRNFYVYFNQLTGKMEWVQWDGGMSFGSYWSAATNYETVSLTYTSNPANRPLTGKIFNNATLKAEYLQAVCRIYNRYFSTERFYPHIDEIANIIRPYVYADPRKMYTNAQFEENLTNDIVVGGHRKPGLKAFIAAREANVATQLADLGVTCAPTVDPGEVVINEFAADNTQILDPAGEAEDWIEMYNNSDEDLDLSGFYMSDDRTVPAKWQFPTGTSIAAGGFLIIWADDDAGQEGLHANFKLSAGGEHVSFASTQAAILDSTSYGQQTTNLTMARIPNGTGPFVQGRPTFNDVNRVGLGQVVINEFAASNTQIFDPAGEAEDWIEMYNNTDDSVDLGGMYLSDSPVAPTKWQFPAGTSIPGRGFLIIWADEDAGQEGLHASFKLSASGEAVVFSDTQAAVLDSVTFGQQTADLTMARIPNGTGPFLQGEPSFNAPNGVVILDPGAVMINEFMASNTQIQDPAGEAEDWIELYNTQTEAIDLSGLYMSDDPAVPAKWQFPDGSVIPPDGYLIIWADEDLTQEGLHAGFKLSASGESIILSNIDLTIVDSTTFGAQVTDVSMARKPNGSGPFVSDPTPTPGATNDDPQSVGEDLLGTNAIVSIRPNPLTESAFVEFRVSRAGRVQLQVIDLQGRLAATLLDKIVQAGTHVQTLRVGGLASGVYVCRMRTAGVDDATRLLVIR